MANGALTRYYHGDVPPQWTEVRPGIQGVELPGADGNVVVFLRETWERKDLAHENLAANWDAVVRTITHCSAVHLSRRFPKQSRLYSHWFERLVHEDGRVAPGHMMVVVLRANDCVQSAYIADDRDGKLGPQVWP